MLNFDDLVDILKELIRQPSVVGAEHSFFRVLQRLLEERNAKVDWYDGVLVARGSEPFSRLFSSHIDRHGLICTGPNEFQYAAFVAGQRSDLLGNSVSEQLMNKIVDRFERQPVQAYEPWSGAYRGNGQVNKAYICPFRNNLIFELEGLDHLVAGTPVAFADRLTVENGRFSAQLDNVLTAAMLVHLFALGFKGTAFFTAQEESGKSWRYLLEWFRRFGSSKNELIVLDTSPYPDLEVVSEQEVVLRHRDANAPFDYDLTQRIVDACEELGIRYSYKDEYIERNNEKAQTEGRPPGSLGSTEMGRIIMAGNGLVSGTTLQVPTIGYHTMSESAEINSCQSMLTLLMNLCELD